MSAVLSAGLVFGLNSSMWLLLWAGLSALVGVYAQKKSGRFWVGFITSLFLSPLLGFIAVAVSKVDEKQLMEKGGMKKCPDCTELVKQDARKCKHCGHLFETK